MDSADPEEGVDNINEEPRSVEWGSIREVSLFPDERVEQVFVPQEGLVATTPAKGPLLVLTSQRVVSFARGNGSQETTLVPLEELKGVSVMRQGRNIRSLFQGLTLVLVGVLAYYFVGLFVISSGSVAVPAAVGAAIALVGLYMMSRYFFWEEEGMVSFIAFSGGNWELNFPYRGSKASEDAPRLVDRFFRLKLEMNHPSAEQTQRPSPILPYDDDWQQPDA